MRYDSITTTITKRVVALGDEKQFQGRRVGWESSRRLDTKPNPAPKSQSKLLDPTKP